MNWNSGNRNPYATIALIPEIRADMMNSFIFMALLYRNGFYYYRTYILKRGNYDPIGIMLYFQEGAGEV